MAVAPLPASVEITDLRRVERFTLAEVFRSEEQEWANNLHWDFAPSSELLQRNIEAGNLPGFVALSGGRAVGYCFFVYEGNKGLLGGLYALPEFDEPGGDIRRRLALHALETLENVPHLQRIEAQLIHFRDSQTRSLFEEHSFDVFPRLFLYRTLEDFSKTREVEGDAPEDWTIAPWSHDFDALADVIADAYDGHVDSRLNDQYSSREGARRFLQNIITFPGCGVFLERSSLRAVDTASGRWQGVVMTSEVAPRVAHVTQICVRQSRRGQGVGRGLLIQSLRRLKEMGFKGVSLTVTASNQRAVQLYRDLGFATLKEFDAYSRNLD